MLNAIMSSVVAAPMSVASSEALLPSMLVPSTLKKSLSITFAFATKTLPFDMPVDSVAVVVTLEPPRLIVVAVRFPSTSATRVPFVMLRLPVLLALSVVVPKANLSSVSSQINKASLPVEPLSIIIPQSLEFDVAPLFNPNKVSLTVVFVVSIVVVVPFTVRLPEKVAFAPLNVTAVVGVEPDFITSSPLLFVKLPNVVPSSLRVTSAPPASKFISPAESNVIVDPVTVSMTGLVRVK